MSPFHPHITAYGIPTPDNGLVFAVEIPKSALAPHQARDGKYYVRSGASSRFATHLEIEGIRHSGSPIDLGIEYYRIEHTGAAPDNVQSMVIGIAVRNNGTRATRGLYVAAYMPVNSEVEFTPAGAIPDPKMHEFDGHEWTRCFIAFGGHTPEILFSGQNTQLVPFFQIESKPHHPLSTSLAPGPVIRFEIQTLDGYRNTITEDSRLLVRRLMPLAEVL